MSNLLITFDDIDAFKEAGNVSASEITPELQASVRKLDEREELEPFIRTILADASDTPHGPAEIADILTHKIRLGAKPRLAAFVLKGKSFPTVRPKHVSHQIYRLEKISGLELAVLASSGTVLDAAKEQFVSTAVRMGVRYSIMDVIDLARLFVAYGFLCPRDGRRIVGGTCQCGYSPNRGSINVLQEASLDELRASHELGQRAGLIVLPTGSGKTRVAALDASRYGAKSILYLAHTQEILDVAQAEFESIFGKDSVTRYTRSAKKSHLNRVNISTVQLLFNRIDGIKPAAFDYIVVDEFHRAAAKSYRKIIKHLKPAFLLGLTATPFRGDRQDILALCGDNVLAEYELRSGVDSGILSPYHYYGCFDNVDYSILSQTNGHYTVRDLEKALIIPDRDAAIVEKWRELAPSKPTLGFCCSMKHARRMAKAFKDASIPAEVYLADTPLDKRRHLIKRLNKGKIHVLFTVDVLNEGADFPFVEALLFLRPTESKRIFFQQLGRGLRRSIGKTHCVVIDFIGNFKNAYRIVEYHGLLPYDQDQPTSPRQFTRSAKEELNLPFGCKVQFDDRVIDIFASQAFDAGRATRQNIRRILIYHYQRLWRSLNHRPTKRDVDRYSFLSSDLYRLAFGSWARFEDTIVGSDIPN